MNVQLVAADKPNQCSQDMFDVVLDESQLEVLLSRHGNMAMQGPPSPNPLSRHNTLPAHMSSNRAHSMDRRDSPHRHLRGSHHDLYDHGGGRDRHSHDNDVSPSHDKLHHDHDHGSADYDRDSGYEKADRRRDYVGHSDQEPRGDSYDHRRADHGSRPYGRERDTIDSKYGSSPRNSSYQQQMKQASIDISFTQGLSTVSR